MSIFSPEETQQKLIQKLLLLKEESLIIKKKVIGNRKHLRHHRDLHKNIINRKLQTLSKTKISLTQVNKTDLQFCKIYPQSQLKFYYL